MADLNLLARLKLIEHALDTRQLILDARIVVAGAQLVDKLLDLVGIECTLLASWRRSQLRDAVNQSLHALILIEVLIIGLLLLNILVALPLIAPGLLADLPLITSCPAIALYIVHLLALITNPKIQPSRAAHKLMASHLIHSIDRSLRILKIHKTNLLPGLILGNPRFDKPLKFKEFLGEILALELLREITHV